MPKSQAKVITIRLDSTGNAIWCPPGNCLWQFSTGGPGITASIMSADGTFVAVADSTAAKKASPILISPGPDSRINFSGAPGDSAIVWYSATEVSNGCI